MATDPTDMASEDWLTDHQLRRLVEAHHSDPPPSGLGTSDESPTLGPDSAFTSQELLRKVGAHGDSE